MQRIEQYPYVATPSAPHDLVPASEVRRLRAGVWLLIAALIIVMVIALWALINATAGQQMAQHSVPAAAPQPVIIQIDGASQRPAAPTQRSRADTKITYDATRLGITSLWQTRSGIWRGLCEGRRRQRICEWDNDDRVWEAEIPGANPPYEIWRW